MECAAISMEVGEWSSINGVSINDEADFMANLFSNSSYSDDQEMCSLSLLSSVYSGHESNIDMVGYDSSSYYTTDTNSNLNSLSQESSPENYYLSDFDQYLGVNVSSLPVEFCLDTKGVIQVFPGNLIERNQILNLEISCDNLEDSEIHPTQPESLQLNAKHEVLEIEPTEEEKSSDSSEVERKRSWNSEVSKVKRNTRTKRSHKLVSNDEENSPLKKQNSGSCSSEEELTGKTRASRGSATDPQSLYARKRRERINERLRILQNLVPNGTKVDMSTMLEEAVNYVKFLQLQIKLLSSDELWMYAPLAYNGMDIGLDAKLNSLL